jgi:hypothetical protein
MNDLGDDQELFSDHAADEIDLVQPSRATHLIEGPHLFSRLRERSLFNWIRALGHNNHSFMVCFAVALRLR